jgi:hypothetical protein
LTGLDDCKLWYYKPNCGTFTRQSKINGTLGQIRWNPKAKAYYQKKITEGKSKKKALVCVMKRIACIVYGMLKNGEEYRG